MPEKQLGKEYYDNLYLTSDRTYERPLTSSYYPLYCKVVELIRQEGVHSVLEVGCGSGILAEMLIAGGLRYRGFDLSPVAIGKAEKRNPAGMFFIGDAVTPASYEVPYDGLVCCEVLEHVEGDLAAIGFWKTGTTVICSVPNSDYESHVRFFRSEAEIVRRYGQLLEIRQIERIATSARANLSWAEYFRRIRWARNQPTRVLGILGINTFAWYGGWFVFVGRRR